MNTQNTTKRSFKKLTEKVRLSTKKNRIFVKK